MPGKLISLKVDEALLQFADACATQAGVTRTALVCDLLRALADGRLGVLPVTENPTLPASPRPGCHPAYPQSICWEPR